LIGPFFFVDKIDIINPLAKTGERMYSPCADKNGEIPRHGIGPCPIEQAPFIYYCYAMEG
jgi:hypothetical protein